MEVLLNDFSPGLFVVQTILLLALIFLMVKFAWKPILNSLNEREAGIEEALAAADKARTDMQNLQADNEKMLQEARA
ncbi:MAG: F0F1 ATP synthase subunit B, partial [Maribacter sp.]|nr:F0F1 ATP synthase subunit B [Maribacter sp.]